MKLASKLAMSNSSTTALTVLLSKEEGIMVQCKTSKMEEALMLAVYRHDQDKAATAIKSGSTHSVKDVK